MVPYLIGKDERNIMQLILLIINFCRFDLIIFIAFSSMAAEVKKKIIFNSFYYAVKLSRFQLFLDKKNNHVSKLRVVSDLFKKTK